MDAYEIRLELLKMAQNAIEQSRMVNYSREENLWRDRNNVGCPPNFNRVTASEIIDYAMELQAFIAKKAVINS
jgi:hypothetical protein